MASASTHARLWKYDVFLSFRGDDVRKNFLDHLYSTLRRKGVYAFKDDKELERGKNIEDGLVQAIRDSRFCIIIFSTRYADSSWCLDELLTIYECVQQGKQTAFPVFYGVDPFDVQNLKGDYGKAFEKHAEKYKDEIVQKWKVAITRLANISGWSLHDRHEVEFIEDIVEDVLGQLRKLRQELPRLSENGLIGMEKHLRRLDLYLRERSNDVCIIGICGMAGIGKTTIARAFFEKMSNQFEGSSFLANVREVEEKHGLGRLQEQLLYETVEERNLRIWETNQGIEEIQTRLWHRKVLVVIDNVNKLEQLKSLAGKTNWFGPGSRIIITTSDESLLKLYKECLIYRVPRLDLSHAYPLFCSKAFGDGSPPSDDFKGLSYAFVESCDRLPLAIDVIGTFLRGLNSRDEWESALDKLKAIPNKDVLDKLKISFDALDEIDQKTFLDIACFFKGTDQNHVRRILKMCDLYPENGIRVLINKSLISVNSKNEVCMHDLLQQMGREIVRRECREEPGRRSRLWLCEDVYHVLLNNTGTELLEGIVIEDSRKEESEWSNVEALSAEAFSKMKRLRLLKLQYLNINRGVEFLPNSLRYLNWYGFPSTSLPIGFQPNRIVELHLPYSSTKQLWKDVKNLKTLKIINLCHSKKLATMLDFRQVPNLEELNLEGCTGLVGLNDSIGVLKALISLNLRDCTNLTSLPNAICNVKSLKILNLSGCSRLGNLPERFGELTNLEILNLERAGREEQSLAWPWDFLLPWKRSSNFKLLTLPSSFPNLSSLKELYLSYCHLKGGLPDDLSCFPLLQILDLRGNDFVSIPAIKLSKLIALVLTDCTKLESVPEFPSTIMYVNLDGCSLLETFPSPCENYNGKLKISAADSYDKPQHKSMVTFEWLASYLRFFRDKMHNQMAANNESISERHASHSTVCSVDCVCLRCQKNPVLELIQALGTTSFGFSRPKLPDLDYHNFGFSMRIHGHTIPRWFYFQRHDASVALVPPPNWCNDQCMGFAVCTSWRLDPIYNLFIQACKELKRSFYVNINIDGITYGEWDSGGDHHEEKQEPSDQLLVFFEPLKFDKYSMDEWNKVRSIEIYCTGLGFEMKSMGFRIVYEQDIEELQQYISSSNCDDGREFNEGCSSSTWM